MGYTLKIGEAKIDFDLEYHSVSIDVDALELPEAPAFGEPTDKMNQRWPSYIAWGEFIRLSGTEHILKNEEDGLMREHPGIFPITDIHRDQIDGAYDAFKKKYPNAEANFETGAPDENGALCRLEWLKFWIDWALVNCEKPVFYNH